jgi:transcription elongation factor GreA
MKDDVKTSLMRQLVFFDEQTLNFLDEHYPAHSPAGIRDRERARETISRYAAYLKQLLSRTDALSDAMDSSVLIGSKVTLHFTSEQISESYVICFPDQSDPASGRISFLSPLGMPLLLATAGQTVRFVTPGGEMEASVARIEWEG